ncbi:MAG: tRNA lysidine(34) synthetase TilS [Gammaproteobacteria bacterium]|nr:tRNA lysidine(34) synthetase TilS [Gammaproteobacteria bacterium]
MSLSARLLAHLAAQLPVDGTVTVAWSGGLDSTVLLWLARCWCQQQPGRRLEAIHIHHGLSPNADGWETHCQRLADGWQLALQVVRVTVNPAPRQSLEACARDARYQAFIDHAAAGVLLLGHHLQDQAETLLLRLGRGTGPAGLAAMAARRPLRPDLQLLRPLLAVSRRELEQLAAAEGLSWIEDESNSDPRFSRNAFRHQLLPLWRQLQPAIDQQLAKTARHCGELQQLADELAAEDLARCLNADGGLPLAALCQLSPARQHNLLRHWLAGQGVAISSAQLQVVMSEVIGAGADRQPYLKLGDWQLLRSRDLLWLLAAELPPLPAQLAWPNWQQPLALADGRVVHLVSGGCLRPPRADEAVSLRFALPGSTRVHPHWRQQGRELVKIWQELAIPGWQRPRLPMLFYGEQLVAAGELWVEQGAVTDASGGLRLVVSG